MSRNARRREPYAPGRERLEVTQEHMTLRLLGLGVALLVAVLSFAYAFNTILQPTTGWQIMEASGSKTGIAGQFTLNYNIGAGELKPEKERKGVTNVYSQALEHAYKVLSGADAAQSGSLATLNARPNETVAVDELLYAALQTVEESGSRILYYAPLFSRYHSLFLADSDETAMYFDPGYSEEAEEYVRELAAFANDPEMVRITLLTDNQVRLQVSEAYLAYAEENEISAFVDFGFLLNAFLCDAAADALVENGYTHGILASFDGYVRVLCDDELAVTLYDLDAGKVVQTGSAVYCGPAELVVCRSFPISSVDASSYYCYADGTIRAPYVARDGQLKTAAATLTALNRQGSVSALALLATSAFAQESLDKTMLDGISYIVTENRGIQAFGDDFIAQYPTGLIVLPK